MLVNCSSSIACRHWAGGSCTVLGCWPGIVRPMPHNPDRQRHSASLACSPHHIAPSSHAPAGATDISTIHITTSTVAAPSYNADTEVAPENSILPVRKQLYMDMLQALYDTTIKPKASSVKLLPPVFAAWSGITLGPFTNDGAYTFLVSTDNKFSVRWNGAPMDGAAGSNVSTTTAAVQAKVAGSTLVDVCMPTMEVMHAYNVAITPVDQSDLLDDEGQTKGSLTLGMSLSEVLKTNFTAAEIDPMAGVNVTASALPPVPTGAKVRPACCDRLLPIGACCLTLLPGGWATCACGIGSAHEQPSECG